MPTSGSLTTCIEGTSLDTRELRNTLGQFATGVCVLTTVSEEGPIAMTVNSFAAVSLDPPLVLWSIQNTSDCFRAFTECERYGISVLQRSQEALSNQYARPQEHRLEANHIRLDAFDTPLVAGALTTFSCRLANVYEAGDHHIIVGHVDAFEREEGEPLLFFGGGYQALA